MSDWIEKRIEFVSRFKHSEVLIDANEILNLLEALQKAEEALRKAKTQFGLASKYIDCEKEIDNCIEALAAIEALGKDYIPDGGKKD